MEYKYTLYVGLNDKDSKVQEIELVEAYKICTKTVQRYASGCTIFDAKGFYTHENGEAVTENTFRIEVMFIGDKEAHAIVNELKISLNQEAIAVTKEPIISELW